MLRLPLLIPYSLTSLYEYNMMWPTLVMEPAHTRPPVSGHISGLRSTETRLTQTIGEGNHLLRLNA